jgi:uncharacterized protein YcbK (DUF882 family)
MSIGTSRRQLLTGMGAAALGLVAHSPLRSLAAAVPTSPERRLCFQSLHTGERLETVYCSALGYREDSLKDIAKILRDHRTNDVHAIDPKLLDQLSELRVALRTDQPFQVISGYRSPETNLKLASASSGVAKQSLHTRGMAIDIRVKDVPLAQLRDTAKALAQGGVGFYPKDDFVHVDVGRVRSW